MLIQRILQKIITASPKVRNSIATARIYHSICLTVAFNNAGNGLASIKSATQRGQ